MGELVECEHGQYFPCCLGPESEMYQNVCYCRCLFLGYCFITTFNASACTLGQQCLSCSERSGYCQEQCYVGYYGNRCDSRCDPGCKGKACTLSTKGTGVCTEGCNPGYYGSTCRAPCLSTPDCHRCSRECEDGYCREDTECFADCQNSYYGRACTTCSTSCKRCNRATGQCQECNPGYGGGDCTQRCKNCNGQCQGGCSGGCRSGYFGAFCEKSCSEGCKSGCDVKTGACACKMGWYGKNCMRRCSINCADGLCDEDGKCFTGCRPGYYGELCSSPCNQSCIEENCVGDLCFQCGKGEAGCKRICKSCHNSCRDGCYKPEKVCMDICASNCPRNICSNTTRLVMSTDVTSETEAEQSQPPVSIQAISLTVTSLASIVISLVVVVIVIMIYFSCYFKRFRNIIYGRVQVRRQDVVENSSSKVSNDSTHEYAEVALDQTCEVDQDINIPMPVIADVFDVVTCDRSQENKASGQSAYIHPVHVSTE